MEKAVANGSPIVVNAWARFTKKGEENGGYPLWEFPRNSSRKRDTTPYRSPRLHLMKTLRLSAILYGLD